jgi:uridine monophosphate synthetase
MFEKTRKVVADTLFRIGAIKFGEFRLKLHEKQPNAPLSPIYVDLRLLRSFPEAMEETVALYRELARPLAHNLLADVPTAATPIVAILSHITKIPMISPRMDGKGHGAGRSIDGVFTPGETVLLIDDLITKAESKLEAIEVLEKAGLVVKDLIVIIDREQGGPQQLAVHGYRCHGGFKLGELLDYYGQCGKIDRGQLEKTLKYLAANA